MSLCSSNGLFSNTIAHNLFSHAYLFYGTNSADLYSICIDLIKNYLNYHHDFTLEPTDSLPVHPDIFFLHDIDSSIKLDHIKAIQDAIKYGPYQLNYFFVIIPNCDLCTLQASNAFLKTLEEPINNVTFFLTTSTIQSILPTIRSRSTCVYFKTNSTHDVSDVFMSFQSFKDLTIEERFNTCSQVSSDKHSLIRHLHNWLTELTCSSLPHPSRDINQIISLLEILQYNVNVRLQLENFSLQL